MPKVYIVNKGGHDYSAAERFGELQYITEGTLAKYDVGQMFRECNKALSDSDPDDYIMLTSLTTLCSVACAIFAYKHGRLNLLIFKDDDYVARRIVFNGTRRQGERRKQSIDA